MILIFGLCPDFAGTVAAFYILHFVFYICWGRFAALIYHIKLPVFL
jgi:hypothetical protein